MSSRGVLACTQVLAPGCSPALALVLDGVEGAEADAATRVIDLGSSRATPVGTAATGIGSWKAEATEPPTGCCARALLLAVTMAAPSDRSSVPYCPAEAAAAAAAVTGASVAVATRRAPLRADSLVLGRLAAAAGWRGGGAGCGA